MPDSTPRTRPSDGIPASPPRIIIEQLAPSVDGGHHPAKRLPGDGVTVTAIVYREGHELVTGRVRYRAPGERRWRYAPMQYTRDFDRLTGAFVVDKTGAWTFGVEAWTDRFGTWRADLVKRVDAAQDPAEDLREGVALLEAAAGAAQGDARATLTVLAAALRNEKEPAPPGLCAGGGAPAARRPHGQPGRSHRHGGP